MDIKIIKNEHPKQKPDVNNLGFGKHFTDHMFIMDYNPQNGWHNARIVPYAPLSLDPACMVLHYGQAIFEGMKAYRTADKRILLFRPDKNMARTNSSNDRLCIPAIDEKFCTEALCELIKVDQDWIPEAPGTSLYIRPFIIATDNHLGVKPSETYQYMIILSPVGSYYKEGINPVKIYVEDNYVRAVKGGMGHTKTAGNYAASIKAQMIAQEKGYTQVLWLDGVERKYVEEVGTMNVFFKIDGKVITPALEGTLLPGVTRDSCIALLKHWNIPVEERKLPIAEIMQANRDGKLEEAFGTGTAAVISPIGELNYEGEIANINNGETGPIAHKLYDAITSIQNGSAEDIFGWTLEVK
ncbi:MAG: branched-chain amino acid aminotransferase [Clostridia bacterium]|nr:branched-chain amino acid aminotransferase [Clostridia bacterium]